jgi:tetratricopeptide (TPR) repeat protein
VSAAVRAPLVLALCALSADAGANPFTPGLDAQRRAAQSLMPAQIALPAPHTRPRNIAVLRIRFYADEDYRAGLFRWADRTKTQLDQLNQIVEPALGVRFEPEGFRRWHRESGSSDIFKMLDELEKLDPGPGVDLVVGFVSALPLVSTSMHEIGAARMLGRHFVLRGMASADEANMLKSLDLLDPSEREQIYSRRKWHKETAVFLHEWLHTLGAVHSSNPERLTNPAYSNRMSNLSIVDTELAATALQARLSERQTGAIDWSGLRALLERSRSKEWFDKEHDDLLALLIAQGARAGKPVSEPQPRGREPEGGLSPEEIETFNKAIELTKANKGEEAWALAQPLGAHFPKSGDVQRMVCRLSYVRAARDEGLAACSRAHDLAPTAPEPLVDAAQARILRKEIPEALVTTDQAAELAKAKTRTDAWVWIAQLYGQLGALTRADEALARAGDKNPNLDQARAALAHDRRRLGVPTGALPADKELDYADRFRKVLSLIDGNKLREARAALEAARKDFPDVPGLEVLSCEIDARQNKLRPAEKACAHALTVMPDLPRAHYLLGHIKLNSGARDGAIAAFKKSIEIDPRETGPWQALADVYRVSGKREALASLKLEYQKVFSRPLR